MLNYVPIFSTNKILREQSRDLIYILLEMAFDELYLNMLVSLIVKFSKHRKHRNY